jgi:hypothetical protein
MILLKYRLTKPKGCAGTEWGTIHKANKNSQVIKKGDKALLRHI